MRINIILIVVFFSFTIIALNSDGIERIGGTQLNGNGCVCHTTIESPNVHVWIEGPDSIITGQSAIYKMYMFGGPAIAGGYNVAVRYGLLNLVDTFSVLIDNELTQNFPLPFSTVNDTIFWEFLYTAPDSVAIDTLYSVGLSTNWDTIPDDRDQWAYGPKFIVRIIENTVPVELVSFNAELMDSKVVLSWSTASEKNNKGFEIERIHTPFLSEGEGDSNWKRIGFVNGEGTSTNIKNYSFVDYNLNNGTYRYRLKQIDFDGSFTYSKVISVEVENAIEEYSLAQNYPNPFNPSTRIQYQVSPGTQVQWGAGRNSHVTLKVYDVIGKEVVTLVNESKPAGKYEVEFSIEVMRQNSSVANDLTSGIYFYRLQAGNFTLTKKMLLIR